MPGINPGHVSISEYIKIISGFGARLKIYVTNVAATSHVTRSPSADDPHQVRCDTDEDDAADEGPPGPRGIGQGASAQLADGYLDAAKGDLPAVQQRDGKK